MYDIYTGLLKSFDTFNDDGSNISITYDYTGDKELISKYNIDSIAGNGDDFTKMTNLLNWLSSHVKHKGNYDNHINDSAVSLLDYAFEKDENGINCSALAAILTGCLLNLGIKARKVYIMPCSPYDSDNHVVCEAYDSYRNKWIMLDPTYDLYLCDTEYMPLNIFEIRNRLAEQKDFMLSLNYCYNGKPYDKNELLAYYAKDMFWFQVNSVQCVNESKGKNAIICFAPEGFDVKKRDLANIDYRIRQFGDSPSVQEWRRYISNRKIIYKNTDILYKCSVITYS